MSFSDTEATLKQEFSKCISYISRAHSVTIAGNDILTSDEIRFITESSFLKAFIAWETFLERSFILYITGLPNKAGFIAIRHASPLSGEHAANMLKGTQKYVDWSNPEIVRKLANLYLQNGDPINSVISSINSDLFDLKTIRNAAAHLTTTTITPLNALAQRKIGTTTTNINVGDFIMTPDPTSPTLTIFESYLKTLEAAAYQLCNWT